MCHMYVDYLLPDAANRNKVLEEDMTPCLSPANPTPPFISATTCYPYLIPEFPESWAFQNFRPHPFREHVSISYYSRPRA